MSQKNHSVDSVDTGGYVSGEILASDSDEGESDNLDDLAVKKSILRADQVLSLVKQSRKRVKPISSDDSEPDDGEFNHATTSSKPSRKKSSSCQLKKLPRPPSETATTTVTNKTVPSQKTPLHKTIAASLASKSTSSTPRNSRKVVDTTPKSRNSENCTTPTLVAPRTRDRLDGSPEGSSDIMATLREISNTLSQVVSRMDKQESRMECMEKTITQRSTPSSSSSSAESTKIKIPPIVRVSVLHHYVLHTLTYYVYTLILCFSLN